MTLVRWSLFSGACLLFLDSALASSADPLFQSDDVLEIRITAPLETLKRKRSLEDELPATVAYENSAGVAVELDVQIRARGRSRHRADICRVPPLRLNFKKSQVKDTLFAKQDKLKLVTHCKFSGAYSDALLREYVAYRLLNLLTNESYRVRLARITYVDTEGVADNDIRYGFLIEHRDRLAKRLDMSPLTISTTKIETLQPQHASLIALFHFMIGNTDFSQIRGMEGDSCCHNHVLYQPEGDAIVSIPYDFDQSGIVDAPYAAPNPRFKLRSVKQRLYRGRCLHNDILPTVIDQYLQQKDNMMALAEETAGMTNASRRKTTNYLKSFFKIIESEKKINNELVKECI